MKLAILQWDPTKRNFEENCNQALHQARNCAGADLILLPELWAIGFMNFDNFQLSAQTIDGLLVNNFKNLAREIKTDIFMGSFVEKLDSHFFNTSVFIDKSGTIKNIYRKIHLFTYKSREAEILNPGTKLTSIDYNGLKIGFATCYDLRFPELFRTHQKKGVDLFIVPAAWPIKRIEHFRLFCQCRAIENLSFLIAPNCCGGEDNKKLGGHSMVIDPFGEIIAEGSESEQIIKTDIDLEKIKYWRENFSSLRDKKQDSFWIEQ